MNRLNFRTSARRATALLLLFLLTLTVSACAGKGSSGGSETTGHDHDHTEEETTAESTAPRITYVDHVFTVQYVRMSGEGESNRPLSAILDSAEELEEYLGKYRDEALNAATADYDAAYFEDHVIVAIRFTELQDTTTHEVTKVRSAVRATSVTLEVTIGCRAGEESENGASWQVLIALDRSTGVANARAATVALTPIN